MAASGFSVAHVSEIPQPASVTTEAGEADWKPVRHHLGVEAFGVNAWVARAEGDRVIEEHEEDSGHQELYFVARGHATFTIGGRSVDAPAGTFVFVRDPGLRRSAVADAAGTTVVALGGWAGRAFEVSDWERRCTEAAA